jgi:hypothetical protein
MKGHLINTCRLRTLSTVLLRATPPLRLAYIAGAQVREGHSVKVIDAIVAAPKQINEFDADIVQRGLSDVELIAMIPGDVDVIGVGCMLWNNWPANRKLINSLGKSFPNANITIGGEHATAVLEIGLG